MKDGNSTRTTDEGSSNAKDAGKPGPGARARTESRIEGVRDLGGVFVEAVQASRLPVVLTDPAISGDPIVFANQPFIDLSGYSLEEVLGQSPHFMRGPDSDLEDDARFQEILASDQDGTVEIIQHAKDGRRFIATVLVSAFTDGAGQTIHHVLTWAKVSCQTGAEEDPGSIRATQAALRRTEERYGSLPEPMIDDEGAINRRAGLALDIDARERAEAVLRGGEENFRRLFESIDEGLAVVEMIYDEPGEIVDLVFRQVNSAYERQTGIEVAVGRSIYDIVPKVEDYWIDIYKNVATTGQPARLEQYQQDVDMWFDVHFNRIDDEGRFIAIVFNNTTVRKRAEAELRASEERQTFLLALGDAMRSQTSAEGVVESAARLLGLKLNASRVAFGEFDNEHDMVLIRRGWTNDGAVTHPATLRQSDFVGPLLDELRAGKTVRFDDVGEPPYARPDLEELAAIGVRAGLSVPFIEGGRLVLNLMVHNHARYCWTDEEVTLAEEVAERTWAALERARGESALRESEERMRLIVENARDYAIFTTDPQGICTDWHEGAEAVFGYAREEIVGRSGDILFTREDRDKEEPNKERATSAATGKASDVRWHVRKGGSQVFIDGVSTALRDPNGKLIGFLKIGHDVSERHAAEERQKLLLAELQHRVRNILAIVRAMVRHTSGTYEDLDEFTAHLVGRLDAMARTQVLLTRSAGSRIDLEGLVRDELEAQIADELRLRVSGPEVKLSPKAAEVLTLALHELATNSTKYGALSDPYGRLSVTWGVAPIAGDTWLQLTWDEHSKQVEPRARKSGFGTELIEDRVPYELRGEGSLHITRGGVRAEIAFPLTDGTSVLETGPTHGRTI